MTHRFLCVFRVFRIAAGLHLLLLAACSPPPAREEATAETLVTRGRFERGSTFPGTVVAAQRELLASSLSQPAALLWLAPEGARVAAGDVVARLDVTPLLPALATLQRDVTLATAERATLLEAEFPLQIAALQEEMRDVQEQLRLAEEALPLWQALAEEALLSPAELREQETRLQRLRETLTARQQRLDLLQQVTHPNRLLQAEARLEGAQRQAALLEDQIAAAELRAGMDGMVVHVPLHLSGEFRTAGPGDQLFRNQTFLQIADVSTLVVSCLIPEAALGRVPPQAPARVTPLAYPELSLAAQVMHIGTAATTQPGSPAREKFFAVTLLLKEPDPRLRIGMTAQVRIQDRLDPQAVLLPRAWVDWQTGEPRVRLRQADGSSRWQAVTLLDGNETHFRVRDGVQPGDRLLRPEGL